MILYSLALEEYGKGNKIDLRGKNLEVKRIKGVFTNGKNKKENNSKEI